MDFVLVGKILTSFGLQGWVKVLSLSDSPGRFVPGASLWVGTPEEAWEKIVVAEVSSGERVVLLRFEGIASRREAEKLQGFFLAVRKEDVSPLPEGHFYHFELLGLTVKEGEKTRGQVTSVIEGPSYDYLVVAGEDGGEFLLPFIRVYIKEVDLGEKILRVECPEGFWE